MPTVVLLLSDKRSGSTMFQDELCNHADIRTVEYSPHTYLETHHWLKGAVLLGKAPETFSGKRVYPGYGSRAGARAYMIDCVKKNVPDFEVPEADRELIFKGWDALCAKYAHPVFFEKSPQHLAQWASLSLLLEWINSTDYSVKVIGLTRNPLSVLYSAYKLFHTDPEKRQYGWLEIQKNMLAFQALLPSGSFMHVKYEDIINKPVDAFSKVCEFIGVAEDKNIGGSVHSSSVNKWKDDPEFILQLDDTVKQVARHFGYSETDLDNSEKKGFVVSRNPMKQLLFWFSRVKLAFRDRVARPLSLWFKQR